MDGSAGLIGSSLEALDKQYQALAHNLANASTAGFKKRTSLFAQELARKEAEASDAASPAEETISQTSVIDFTQGALQRTGRPLDLAIAGEGMFVLETPAGPLYTRNGVFQTNAQGQLVDFAGRTVAGQGGPGRLDRPSVRPAQPPTINPTPPNTKSRRDSFIERSIRV